MANITITKTGNSISVVFNDYASAVGSLKRSFSINDIIEVSLNSDNVEVLMSDSTHARKWQLTYDLAYVGNQKMIIDSIDGVTPTSESDLYDKITALRG